MGEQGGEEYLVRASIKTLATALSQHAKEKELDMAALFKEAGGGKAVKEKAFLKYIAELPEKIGHEELEFTEERRLAVFKVLDADKDGAVSSAEFQAMFVQKATCKKEISLTESATITDGNTVGKIEPQTELEIFGLPKEVEEMQRYQCKLADGKEGWITFKGNQGSAFLWINNPFEAFFQDLNKTVADSLTNVNSFQKYLGQKIREASHHPSGPVTEALTATKGELEKLKPQFSEKVKSLEELKKKLG